MAQPLIKFFRVAELPTGAGVPGALYFVHDSSLGEGKGKLYICTAIGVFEDYTGLHSYENTNTTYDLKSVVNELKGQIQLVGSDETVDNLYIEGGDNIKVSSTADGVKVEHTTPTEGTALVAEATEKTPGYAGTFTAVTGLKKDANGHIVEATLETIKLPGEQDLSNYKTKQTAVADVAATGTDVTTVVTSVTQNENGEITVTKGTIPALSADVDSIDGVDGALTLRKGLTEIGSVNLAMNGKEIEASLVGSFEDGAQVNILEGVKVGGTPLEIGKTDKAVNWKLIYNSDAKKLQVLDLNNSNAVVNEVDATDFIKDGMVSDAKIVWCTVDAEGKHVEVEASAEGAIRCLRITFNTDAGKEAIHIPLNELTDVYTGREGEIEVTEQNVIGLVDKEVEETKGEAINPTLGGTFDVVTDVTYDEKGRLATVETSTVTLPTIAEGDKTGSDDYVSVQVKTTAGAVSEVTVNTDELSTKISGIEADITEVAQVTAAALVDLDSRLDGVEAGTIKSVTGEANELNNTAYVNVKATTENGAVTLASSVKAVEATEPAKYPSTGLATDGYVNEKVATVAATAGTAVQKIESKDATIQVTRAEGKNDVNLELVWAAFE